MKCVPVYISWSRPAVTHNPPLWGDLPLPQAWGVLVRPQRPPSCPMTSSVSWRAWTHHRTSFLVKKVQSWNRERDRESQREGLCPSISQQPITAHIPLCCCEDGDDLCASSLRKPWYLRGKAMCSRCDRSPDTPPAAPPWMLSACCPSCSTDAPITGTSCCSEIRPEPFTFRSQQDSEQPFQLILTPERCCLHVLLVQPHCHEAVTDKSLWLDTIIGYANSQVSKYNKPEWRNEKY